MDTKTKLKCQRCGETEDIMPIHRFGAPVPTMLCRQCDKEYLRERDAFYAESRRLGQE